MKNKQHAPQAGDQKDPSKIRPVAWRPPPKPTENGADGSRVCPVCLGQTLIEIRGKLQCDRCHTICETCCEGGRC